MTKPDDIAQSLMSRGMSEARARDKAILFELIGLSIGAAADSSEAMSLFVPGRIEFLGKHTDYAGGRSLVCAVERGFCFSARPRPDNRIVVRDVVRDLESTFEISPDLVPRFGTWESYGMVVARRIAQNFPGELRGADVYFASDLSPAAGMSTSSALVTAFFRILAGINALPRHPAYFSQLQSPAALAEYLGAVENGSTFQALGGDTGVGTSGGSQDHAAILLSEPNKLLLCAFGPVRREDSIPLPSGFTFVVGVSGVVAEKTGAARAAYNRIARSTTRILELWNQARGRSDRTLMAAVSHHPEAHHQLREILESTADPQFGQGTLLARLEQAVMETTVLIPDAVEALRRADLTALGATVDLSQILAERMLENQVPETIALARLAREQGAVAASAFGAGFGGSVYAVVAAEEAEEFKSRWSEAYLAAFPGREPSAEFFLTRPGPPVTIL